MPMIEHEASLVFATYIIIWAQKLKIPSKFDFRLNINDFSKVFLFQFQNMENYL